MHSILHVHGLFALWQPDPPEALHAASQALISAAHRQLLSVKVPLPVPGTRAPAVHAWQTALSPSQEMSQAHGLDVVSLMGHDVVQPVPPTVLQSVSAAWPAAAHSPE